MATWYMMSFQNGNSPYADNLMIFHNFTLMMLLLIITTVLYLLMMMIINKLMNRFITQHHTIEIIWTIVPMFILLFICVPSLKTLYLMDELWDPTYFTIKSIGHQWYWTYEYDDFNSKSFDSYMEMYNDMQQFRLLDVDNRMIVPYNLPIRMLTTSEDVIHSWTVPSLGMKMDSTPGRINQSNLYCTRPGMFYGQCSEICGTNHSFMPITVESTKFKNFLNWIMS